jgi:PPM family protein phosphatase
MMALERQFGERSASVTEKGRRAVNQDAAVAVTLPDGSELVAVADGMGGHAAGEVASQSALDALQAALERGLGLREAVEAANGAVLAEARARPECEGMGTTLVALLRRGGEYMIANVGDSRAYRYDGSGLQQLTRDHSFIEDAVRSGQLTPEEAGASPWRNALTRAIGLGPDLEVDCYGPYSAGDPHLVILCTDGLYRAVEADHMLRIAGGGEEPAAMATELAGAAFEAGSDDNITLAIARFGADTAWQEPVAAGAAGEWKGKAEQVEVQLVRDDGGRRGRKRRRGGATRRWAALEVTAIMLGVLAVILYVIILSNML